MESKSKDIASFNWLTETNRKKSLMKTRKAFALNGKRFFYATSTRSCDMGISPGRCALLLHK